jgi:transposase-like protein
MDKQVVSSLPEWVPDHAQRYLEHIESGRPIRDLARAAGVHASTVLRQVRRLESRRDDPLVDAALTVLASAHFLPAARRTASVCQAGNRKEDTTAMTSANSDVDKAPDAATLEREACRVLRRLCENGAVMAVAEKMEKAVVVRDGGAGGAGARTAVVDCSIAQAMALKDWISCTTPGRVSRYRITAAGRSALSRMLASEENHARAAKENGFAEAQTPFGDQHRDWGEKTVADTGTGQSRRMRYNMSESPLTALARRKDRDGKPFLDEALVNAGERLREDFELAQMGPRVTQNWDSFMTQGGRGGFAPDSGVGNGASGARDRVARALVDLGPGLSDVALRCCCYLEGLENAEKRMGWSARSGKIVLRIALQRLRQHYESRSGADRMIG